MPGNAQAKQAFSHLADSLKTLLSHSAVQLELDPPANDRSLTSTTAHAVRVSVRAAVLAALPQSEVRRIRVGWQLGLTELVATVRDDGPGVPRDDLRAGQIAQRVEAQGCSFELDAVPGWWEDDQADVSPGIVRGRRRKDPQARTRPLAEHRAPTHWPVWEHETVKFHVANILSKLSVGSRGEAAALFHSATAV